MRRWIHGGPCGCHTSHGAVSYAGAMRDRPRSWTFWANSVPNLPRNRWYVLSARLTIVRCLGFLIRLICSGVAFYFWILWVFALSLLFSALHFECFRNRKLFIWDSELDSYIVTGKFVITVYLIVFWGYGSPESYPFDIGTASLQGVWIVFNWLILLNYCFI